MILHIRFSKLIIGGSYVEQVWYPSSAANIVQSPSVRQVCNILNPHTIGIFDILRCPITKSNMFVELGRIHNMVFDSVLLSPHEQLEPELDFDREVYPLGISPAAGIIVGITQRLTLSGAVLMPCFEPNPQAVPILPCILWHLLQVCYGFDSKILTIVYFTIIVLLILILKKWQRM